MFNPENIQEAENLVEMITESFSEYTDATYAGDKNYEDTAIEAWRGFLETLFPYLKICAEMCVKNIGKTVMQKIWDYVNFENAFTIGDDKIYSRYQEIMAKYEEVSAVYNETLPEINDLRISEIFKGVSEILSAQLKQHEEHMCGTGVLENPVVYEKERIMNSVGESVTEALRIVAKRILSENGYFEKGELISLCMDSRDSSAKESHIDIFTFIYQRAIEKGGLDIYKSYSGAIMECKSAVNSLDMRKEAGFFCDAVKQEKENLDSIVNIQTAALAELVGNASGAEVGAIRRITGLLTEARDIAEEEAAELDRIFSEAERTVKMPSLMNYDDFLSYIEEKGLCASADRMTAQELEAGTFSAVNRWKEELDKFLKNFEGFLSENTVPSVDIKPYKRFLYETRLKISDKIILTDEMLKGVRRLAGYYEENQDRLRKSVPEDLMKIIDGINESILIKIDVLLDGSRSFAEEASQLLSGCIPPELSDLEEKELFALRLEAWQREMLDTDVYVPDYFNTARNHIPRIIQKTCEIENPENYRAKLDRKIDKEADGILRLEAAYLKDCLLFEIITFEEILMYSVSKLRESGNQGAAEYALRCGELEETLKKICKLHNIMLIAPKPYDAFNGIEHEVLVAEKNDGYKKGQIIKMMNSGFKYNETVLVRANVIAAK